MPRRDVARCELLPSARRRRESLGERVDYTEVTPSTKRALVSTVRGARGEGNQSRRPERLLRAPRLSFQILELLRVARRVARVLTLEDLREAVETLEETERIAQRVFGGANPTVGAIVDALRVARAALNARRETSRESNS